MNAKITLSQLNDKIKDFIERNLHNHNEKEFNDLALEILSFQYENNQAYREFCDASNISIEKITNWSEIPAIPAKQFKHDIVASFPLDEVQLSTLSSGTTDPNLRGKIYRDQSSTDLTLWVNKLVTKEFLFPDIEKIIILLLVPSPEIAPGMGMAVGLEEVRRNFGTNDSEYLIDENGLNFSRLVELLQKSEETLEPVALIGATSGFVLFLQMCKEKNLKFKLPKGSRICDGGGYRGIFGDFNKTEIYSMCAETFGLEEECYINTLGTSESSTNYFDNVYRDKVLGKDKSKRYKVTLPWTRVLAINPETGQRLPKGEIGLLRHYDLVNSAMAIGVQTDNLGYETEDGFEIIARSDLRREINHLTNLESLVSLQDNNQVVCSTIADNMMASQDSVCTTAADNMLRRKDAVCSTIADNMLSQHDTVCSTIADELLTHEENSSQPDELIDEKEEMENRMVLKGTEYAKAAKEDSFHQRLFKKLTDKQLNNARELCPFYQLVKYIKKN